MEVEAPGAIHNLFYLPHRFTCGSLYHMHAVHVTVLVPVHTCSVVRKKE